MLEEDISVFCGAAESGVIRVERMGAEFVDCVHVDHRRELVVVPYLDLMDLVRGTEAVEEVDERHLALDSCEVSDGSEVHDLLNI